MAEVAVLTLDGIVRIYSVPTLQEKKMILGMSPSSIGCSRDGKYLLTQWSVKNSTGIGGTWNANMVDIETEAEVLKLSDFYFSRSFIAKGQLLYGMVPRESDLVAAFQSGSGSLGVMIHNGDTLFSDDGVTNINTPFAWDLSPDNSLLAVVSASSFGKSRSISTISTYSADSGTKKRSFSPDMGLGMEINWPKQDRMLVLGYPSGQPNASCIRLIDSEEGAILCDIQGANTFRATADGYVAYSSYGSKSVTIIKYSKKVWGGSDESHLPIIEEDEKCRG